MHASLVRLIDVALLAIGTEAANVRTMVEVVRVVAMLLNALSYEPRRLNPIQHRHAIVHENESIGCLLKSRLYIHIPLLDHLDGLRSTKSEVTLHSYVPQNHLQNVQQEHLVIGNQD